MPVTTETLDEVMVEVRRFLERARDAAKVLKKSNYYGENPLEKGAVKRASMDLTRALVKLRK